MLRTTVQCLALAPVALAAVFEQMAAAPRSGWTVMKKPPAKSDTQIFTIALAMQNLDQLESKLLSVSTPGSPAYGQFMDGDQVAAAFAPSREAVSSVTGWLKSNRISHYKVDGAFIDFAADIDTANKLFNATYKYYGKDGVTKLRTSSYSIPDSIAHHVTLVDPGVYLGSTLAMRPTPSEPTPTEKQKRDTQGTETRPSVAASCQTSITPSCLKQMYSVGSYAPDAKSGSYIGFGSFLNESAQYADNFQFEDLFGIPRQSFEVELIAGGVNNQNTSTANFGEADLDIECIIGIAHPLPVVEYITGGSP